jgi:hypothetical protein
MASSALLTKLVAFVLGIGVGVVGLAAVTPVLSPSAEQVAEEQEAADAPTGPQVYGDR